MRIAFAKPDWGIAGGFEVVLRHIEHGLLSRGHAVDWLTVEVAKLSRTPFGVDVPASIWKRGFEFFRYLAMVEVFQGFDARSYDVIVSTQPPSFHVEHQRHLALFYHHHRVFYDLSDVYLAAGLAERAPHERAQTSVRRVDTPALAAVTQFLAPSETVKGRLRAFNGVATNVGLYQAGSGLPEHLLVSDDDRFEHVLCVSRHEFPKRTELFVHAMKFLPGSVGFAVGAGGRLPWVQSLDAVLSAPGADLGAWEDRDLWLCRPEPSTTTPAQGESKLRFLSHVPDVDLADLYRSALCVVAPAYQEDYGLTAIEAMAFGKPLIVCKDGGGLTELVEDGVTGFVVEPNGKAISEAVRTLEADPALARSLGRNGLQVGRRYGWNRAMQQFFDALSRLAG